MDELALLDLLDCPLCLERLDVTAKALPCQHTFCKPCLRRLAASQSELRCPECRTVAPVGVEELPANLLLVRLLEGLRQGPGAGVRAGPGIYSAALTRDQPVRRSRYSQSPQRRPMQGHRNVLDGVPWARALCNYRGNIPGELSIKSGDVIILRRKVDENWYHGEANGNSGLVPANVVRVVNQLPQPLPLCRALYDFEAKDKDQEEVQDCLTFFKGDIISVIRRVDENWVEGKLGEKVGIFPLQFTEPNSAAVKLLDKRKTSESGPQTQTQTRTRSSSESRLGPAAPGVPGALTRPGLPAQGPADIGLPVFQSSSSLAAPARVGEGHREVTGSALHQGSTVVPGERKPSSDPVSTTVAMALMNPQPHSMESKHSSNRQLSISVCAALYPYSPRRAEELELKKGEMVGVYGKFKEGWLQALSLRTGKVGILPSNYVTPVLRTSARLLDPKSTQSQKSATGKKTVTGKLCTPLATNGTVRPAGQAPVVAVTATGSGMRAAQQEGTQRRSSMRHRGHSTQGSLRGRSPAPVAAVVRPQQLLPSGGLAQMQGLSCVHAVQRGKLSHPENLGRPVSWISETTLPSAGDSLVLDLRDATAKELPDRQFTAGLQSILVKPDAHKNNMEKPMKTVRFQTQEAPATGQRMVAVPAVLGGPGSSSVQPVGPGLELWTSLVPSGPMSVDGNATAPKKVMAMDPAFVDGLPPGLKPTYSSLSQPNTCRYRVMAAYTAQTETELHLREGELVLVQRPRQDGRVLVTHEKSRKTGLFQGGVLEVLEKLS